MVMAKIEGPSTTVETCADKLKGIVDDLYTMPDNVAHDNREEGITETLPVSNDELIAAPRALWLKKTLGPDGIPMWYVKVFFAYLDIVR